MWWSLFAAALLCTVVDAKYSKVRLRGSEEEGYVCGNVDIRNSVESLEILRGCRVVEGFVQIVLIESRNETLFENVSFPELVEITCYLLVYRVFGLRSIGSLFPNLAVIRGYTLIVNYALIVFQNDHLQELGLWSLKSVLRGSVRIERNDALCFLDTVDWDVIVPHGENYFSDNKELCPGRESCGWNCTHCWGVEHPEHCRADNKLKDKKCNDLCIGDCRGPGPQQCLVCKKLLLGDVCVDSCPSHMFEYLGRLCVNETECKQMQPWPLTTDGTLAGPWGPFNGACVQTCPSLKADGNHDRPWWLFNGVCVQACPTGYEERYSDDGKKICAPCVGRCPTKCQGEKITSIQMAQYYRGCTYVQGALSIQVTGRHIMEELERSLGSIEEVENYIKIARSFPLISLSFLKNLRVVHGRELDQSKYAFVVYENQNLVELWNWTTKPRDFQIKNGSLFFHNNHKLCLSHIEELRTIAKLPKFTNLEVAQESNGDKEACDIFTIKARVKIQHSTIVVIEWEPCAMCNIQTLLGYIVYYIEAPQQNITLYNGREACKNTGWRVIYMEMMEVSMKTKDKVEKLLQPLKPNTQYGFYVETYSVTNSSTVNKGGRSKIQYFMTKPDRPSFPTNVYGFSNSSSEIVMQWEPPLHPNGVLTKYIISGMWQRDNQKFLDQRNYCQYPISKTKRNEIPKIFQTRNLKNKTKSCCEMELERMEITDKVEYEHMCEKHNKFHLTRFATWGDDGEIDACKNYIYTYLHNEMSENTSVTNFTRQIFPSQVTQPTPGYALPPENQTVMVDGVYESFTLRVEANTTTIVIRNLHHFAEYNIKLVACREQYFDKEENITDTNYCSFASYVTVRTLHDPRFDRINSKHLAVDSHNGSKSDVYLSWKEPRNPNGIIVAYQIEHRRTDIKNYKPTRECITRKQHESSSGYVLKRLVPGKYGFRIQATSLAGDGEFTDMIYYVIEAKSSGLTNDKIIAICIILILCTCFVAAFVYWWKSVKALKLKRLLFASVNPDYVSTNGNAYVEDEWEMPRDKLNLLKELGQGSFGTVYEGLVKTTKTRCAVKTVADSATTRERMEFLNEASVMKSFSNAHHVVKLLGVVSRGQPPFVIMELMILGDLKTHLRSTRKPSPSQLDQQQLLLMAAQIADGMAFLDASKFVHRDLAARNCMVAEDLTVKIGDFGMTRDIYETDYYRNGIQGLLPVRWMAPESLRDGVFTTLSDVWSYGVVLWEIATLAEQPYQGMANEQVLTHVLGGECLEPPQDCSKVLHCIMENCWNRRASCRPRFYHILEELESVLKFGEEFRELSFFYSEDMKEWKASLADKKVDKESESDPTEYLTSTGCPTVTFYHSNQENGFAAICSLNGECREEMNLLEDEAPGFQNPVESHYVPHQLSAECDQNSDLSQLIGDLGARKKLLNGEVNGCSHQLS